MNAGIGSAGITGVFSLEQVAAARAAAAESGRRLLAVMEELAGLAPQDFLQQLAETFGYPSLDLAALDRLQPAFDRMSYAESATREAIVLRGPDDGLILAFVDPFDMSLQTWADEHLPVDAARVLVHNAELVAWLARHEETMQAMAGALVATGGVAADGLRAEDLTLRSISEDTSPAVRLVHSTIYDALKAGASDIHMESNASGLSIKYRIDGVLESIGAIDGVALAEQALSRIKIMSELDIAERRVPQDGRFKVSIKGREIDFRVSIMPSIHSEDAVLRILDKQNLADSMRGLRLEYLGFADTTIRQLRRLAQEPHGMLLVTGPTGSGKTTTLYALITEINTGRDKVITIEDPVEYQLPGVLQIPVNAKKGLTFARGLRSILRHDPDKIMVGEIRDQETAQIAVQSALTGHLVFTTVHANNVFDVIGRFLHMGVDPYSFVAALNGVAAQRLLRVICPHCAREEKPDAQLIAESGLDLAATRKYVWRRGAGCGQCRGSGYKGRKAVAEVLNMNDELREMIVERAPIRRIKETAQRHGLSTLRANALELVRQGETDLQEINRATLIG